MMGSKNSNGNMMNGPGMASRMMQMMPMMAGRMLSECSGEDKKDYLFEMVGRMVEEATSELSDDEYSELVKDLSENLMKRNSAREESRKSCC